MAYQGLTGAPTVFPTARLPKGKKPCMYGDRGPDGKCPKKQRSGGGRRGGRGRGGASGGGRKESASSVFAGLPAPSREFKEPKKTRRQRAAERRLETVAVNATVRAGRKTAIKAAESPLGQKAIGAAARAAGYLGTNVGALTGAAAAGAVGLAIAAGTASFLITSKILKGIRDRREQRQQAAFEAAHQVRLARLDAEKRLGRPLNAAERARIVKAFDLDLLLNKIGIISER